MIRHIFRDYTMRRRQANLLKRWLAAFGLAVGAARTGSFEGRLLWIWLIFPLPTVYLGYVFYPAMWRRSRKSRIRIGPGAMIAAPGAGVHLSWGRSGFDGRI